MDHRSITPISLQRAIYLDFEGVGRSPTCPTPRPHLLGVYRPSEKASNRASYVAHLFRTEWKPIANGLSACVGPSDLCMTIGQLVDLAKHEERTLIYWSDYESQAVSNHCPNRSDEFERVSLNLKPLVDTMVNRLGLADRLPEGRRSLAGYMKVLFPRTTEMTSLNGGAAEACRRLDRYCSTDGRWGAWPDSHKNVARNLIEYNKSDCRSTWRLAVRLAKHIASRGTSLKA